jgi:hypothetical protein
MQVAESLGPAHTLAAGIAAGGSMATEAWSGTTDDHVRLSLLTLSARLESEWRAAAERLLGSLPDSEERQRWDTALARLTDALASLEGYAGGLDTTLGRRDWAARRPRLYQVPSQPMRSGNRGD